jgi:hypothetical protein
MPRKTGHLINIYPQNYKSPKFSLDSVADSNYRGKCDVAGFLIFEWTLCIVEVYFLRVVNIICISIFICIGYEHYFTTYIF